MTAPNGGTIPQGTSFDITWGSAGLGSGTIELDLMNSDGSTIISSIANAETNDGTYTWNTSGLTAGIYRVRVSATSDANLNDQSDAAFALLAGPSLPDTPGIVVLTTPNGGETVSNSTTISWGSAGLGSDTVELDLMNSAGTSVVSSIADAETNDGTYT